MSELPDTTALTSINARTSIDDPALVDNPAATSPHTLNALWGDCRWQPHPQLVGAPAGGWRDWLTARGSLTKKLSLAAQQPITVEVLNQGVGQISRIESRWLQQSRGRVSIRHVMLCVNGEPWVFARSLLPLSQRHPLYRAWQGLGRQALGHVLFNLPGVTRGALYHCRPAQLPLTSLWGRASCFSYQGAPLWVCEHFLPAMARCLDLPYPPNVNADSKVCRR